MKLLLHSNTSLSTEQQKAPADLLANGTLTFTHLDCRRGQVALTDQAAAECDILCALCAQRVGVSRAKLIQDVRSLLLSNTRSRVSVPGRQAEIEIIWEPQTTGSRGRRRRDDGDRRALQFAAVVLLFLLIGFMALGVYYFFSSMAGVT